MTSVALGSQQRPDLLLEKLAPGRRRLSARERGAYQDSYGHACSKPIHQLAEILPQSDW
jgi:hypothetical protein